MESRNIAYQVVGFEHIPVNGSTAQTRSHSRNWRYGERVLKLQADTFFQTVFVSTFVYAYQQSGSLLKEVYLLYFVKKKLAITVVHDWFKDLKVPMMIAYKRTFCSNSKGGCTLPPLQQLFSMALCRQSTVLKTIKLLLLFTYFKIFSKHCYSILKFLNG